MSVAYAQMCLFFVSAVTKNNYNIIFVNVCICDILKQIARVEEYLKYKSPFLKGFKVSTRVKVCCYT